MICAIIITCVNSIWGLVIRDHKTLAEADAFLIIHTQVYICQRYILSTSEEYLTPGPYSDSSLYPRQPGPPQHWLASFICRSGTGTTESRTTAALFFISLSLALLPPFYHFELLTTHFSSLTWTKNKFQEFVDVKTRSKKNLWDTEDVLFNCGWATIKNEDC